MRRFWGGRRPRPPRRPPSGTWGGAGAAAFRADGGDADWCALRVASVTGVRHRLAGQPGQDSFAWAVLPDRLVVAVADGLGGVPGSDATAGRAVLAGGRGGGQGDGEK